VNTAISGKEFPGLPSVHAHAGKKQSGDDQGSALMGVFSDLLQTLNTPFSTPLAHSTVTHAATVGKSVRAAVKTVDSHATPLGNSPGATALPQKPVLQVPVKSVLQVPVKSVLQVPVKSKETGTEKPDSTPSIQPSVKSSIQTARSEVPTEALGKSGTYAQAADLAGKHAASPANVPDRHQMTTNNLLPSELPVQLTRSDSTARTSMVRAAVKPGSPNGSGVKGTDVVPENHSDLSVQHRAMPSVSAKAKPTPSAEVKSAIAQPETPSLQGLTQSPSDVRNQTQNVTPSIPVTPASTHTISMTDPNRHEALKEIVVQQVQTGQDEIKVQIRPEGLGNIVISVTKQNDGGVQVHMVANQMSTMQWLTDQSNQIADAVRTSGIDLSGVQVIFGRADIGNSSGGQSRRQKQEHNGSRVSSVESTGSSAEWTHTQDYLDWRKSGISLQA
jgi:Flagellar hook-length control protein FliK